MRIALYCQVMVKVIKMLFFYGSIIWILRYNFVMWETTEHTTDNTSTWRTKMGVGQSKTMILRSRQNVKYKIRAIILGTDAQQMTDNARV